MKKEELQHYINKQLKSVDDAWGNHLISVKQLPNPLYMVEPNQREFKWSEDDNKVYQILDKLHTTLDSLSKEINK